MIWILFLLIISGVGFSVLSLFFSSNDENNWRERQNRFQNKAERELRDLRDHSFSLEMDLKELMRLHASLHKEIKQFKSPNFAYDPSAGALEIVPPDSVSGVKIQDQSDQINFLQEENQKLSDRLVEAALDIEKLTKEKENQAGLIVQLLEKETYLQSQIDEMRVKFDQLENEFSQLKRIKEEMKEKLLTQKIIVCDAEKDAERLRQENKELMDGLSYERNG